MLTGVTGGLVSSTAVTLSFAKTLADKLNARPGFRAFLTRSDDTFVSLPERVTIARQGKANADLARLSFGFVAGFAIIPPS